MLDRAYCLSSSWSYFTEECDRLKSVFSKLKYPKHLVDSTVRTFLISRVTDQSLLQSKSTTENTIRVIIPFKYQVSANIVKTQLKDLSVKLQVNVQPVFTSRKISQSSRQTNQSLSSLINNVLFIISSVTSVMLVMPDTPVDICSYMSTDIEGRPRQFVSTMIIDTQAGFQMTFTVVLRC